MKKRITIESLKKGDELYYIERYTIKRIKYLCLHPNNVNYFIFINELEEPIRIIKCKVIEILDAYFPDLISANIGLSQKFLSESKSFEIYAEELKKSLKTKNIKTKRK